MNPAPSPSNFSSAPLLRLGNIPSPEVTTLPLESPEPPPTSSVGLLRRAISSLLPIPVRQAGPAKRATIKAFAWGDNSYGKLGNDGSTQSSVPVAVAATGVLAGKTLTAISAGATHSLALCADGTLAAWGYNRSGQLGNGSTTQSPVPVAVHTAGVLAGKNVKAIAAGRHHSLALCSDGALVAWGQNVFGQLGNGSTVDSPVDSAMPVAVDTNGVLAGQTVTAISAGAYHNLALCADGTLVAWGDNSYGQLGNNGTAIGPMPVAVDTTGALAGKTIIAISAGAQHSLALCADGTLAAWGYNIRGQLGNNTTKNSHVPVAVNSSGVLAGKTVIAIAAGAQHSLALCADNTIAAWGLNFDGQLGGNSTAQSNVPVSVTAAKVLAGKTVTTITAGEYHSLALCSDGTLAAWGYNNGGQLGNDSTTGSTVPVAVSTIHLDSGDRFLAVTSGSNAFHSFALIGPAPMGASAPIITQVNSSRATGFYKAGAVILITLTFSASVEVTGTPSLTLNSGGIAFYSSGSGTNTLTFEYTVSTGENSTALDAFSCYSLDIENATIKATAGGAAAILILPAPGTYGSLGASKRLVIDTIRPKVLSITRLGGKAQTTSANHVTFLVTFSKTVTNVSASNFSLKSVDGGTVKGIIGTVTGSGNSWMVPVTLTGGAGEFGLQVR